MSSVPKFINSSDRVEVRNDSVIVSFGDRKTVLYLDENGYIKRMRGVVSYDSKRINSTDRPSWVGSYKEDDIPTSKNLAVDIEKTPTSASLTGMKTPGFPDGILIVSCGVLVGTKTEEGLTGHVGQVYSFENKCGDASFYGVFEGGIIEEYK